jgi:hypothetical protein
LFLTDMPRGKRWKYSDFIGAIRCTWLQCFPSIFRCVSQCPCFIPIWAGNVWFHIICGLVSGVNCTAIGSQSADVSQYLLNKPFVWKIFDLYVSSYAKRHVMYWVIQFWM